MKHRRHILLSHLLSDKLEKKKKMPSSGNCFTLLFLIFHMKGFYLSTGGSRKAGFLWSRYIHIESCSDGGGRRPGKLEKW